MFSCLFVILVSGRSSECVASVPRWKRSLKRRSYTEGGALFLSDSREQVSTPQRRVSEHIYNSGAFMVEKGHLNLAFKVQLCPHMCWEIEKPFTVSDV